MEPYLIAVVTNFSPIFFHFHWASILQPGFRQYYSLKMEPPHKLGLFFPQCFGLCTPLHPPQTTPPPKKTHPPPAPPPPPPPPPPTPPPPPPPPPPPRPPPRCSTRSSPALFLFFVFFFAAFKKNCSTPASSNGLVPVFSMPGSSHFW